MKRMSHSHPNTREPKGGQLELNRIQDPALLKRLRSSTWSKRSTKALSLKTVGGLPAGSVQIHGSL